MGGGGGGVTLRCKEVRPPLEETEIGGFTDPSGPILLPLSKPFTFLERMRLGVSRLEISLNVPNKTFSWDVTQCYNLLLLHVSYKHIYIYIYP